MSITQLIRKRLKDFSATYSMYRKHHPFAYAVKQAWGIAVIGRDF
jgi:hypothetical protein